MIVETLVPVYSKDFYPNLWETQEAPLPTISVDGHIWQMGPRFVNDKSSMPWIVQLALRLARSNGVTDAAAAWHDWLYRWWQRVSPDIAFAQKYADRVFLKLMVSGIPEILPEPPSPWYAVLRRCSVSRHNREVRRLRRVVARKYKAVRTFGHRFIGPGDGTPPRKVREALAARGYDWKDRLA